MKSNTVSPVVKLAGLGILCIAIFYFSQGVKELTRFAKELPVEGMVEKASTAPKKAGPAITTKESIHPVLVESKARLQASEIPVDPGASRSLDEVFEKSTLPVPTAAAAPIVVGFDSLRTRASLEAIVDNGAVINGRFVEKGGKLIGTPFHSADGSKYLYARLVEIASDYVVVSAGPGQKLKLQLR